MTRKKSSSTSAKHGKTLRRTPGRTIVINLAIVPDPPPDNSKADPNGYYEVLGLDPSREWSSDDIKRAYRVKAKKYHPDGSSPNPDAFRRVQLAYSVLKDPGMRAKYDELDARSQWLDEEIIAAIIKRVISSSGGDTKDLTAAIRSKLIQEDVVVEGDTPPPQPRFDGYSYYYYDGEEVPPAGVRDQWVELLVEEMWGRGMRGEVRLGFTEREPHVVKKQWGEVFMASGPPSSKAVSNLLELVELQPTLGGETL